jgi:hypothetical protein
LTTVTEASCIEREGERSRDRDNTSVGDAMLLAARKKSRRKIISETLPEIAFENPNAFMSGKMEHKPF